MINANLRIKTEFHWINVVRMLNASLIVYTVNQVLKEYQKKA